MAHWIDSSYSLAGVAVPRNLGRLPVRRLGICAQRFGLERCGTCSERSRNWPRGGLVAELCTDAVLDTVRRLAGSRMAAADFVAEVREGYRWRLD